MTNRAFTLIELLVAVAISSMVLIFVSYFVVDISNFGTNLSGRLEVARELELTLRIIVSEVRSMGPSANGSYPIAIADGTTFEFYSDLEGDGSFEQVRYFLSGTTLKKGVTKPVGSPATYPAGNEIVTDVVHYLVPGAIFTYYGAGLPSEIGPLAAPVSIALIRLIKVSGTVDQDTTRPPSAATLSVHITIRNLRGDI